MRKLRAIGKDVEAATAKQSLIEPLMRFTRFLDEKCSWWLANPRLEPCSLPDSFLGIFEAEAWLLRLQILADALSKHRTPSYLSGLRCLLDIWRRQAKALSPFSVDELVNFSPNGAKTAEHIARMSSKSQIVSDIMDGRRGAARYFPSLLLEELETTLNLCEDLSKIHPSTSVAIDRFKMNFVLNYLGPSKSAATFNLFVEWLRDKILEVKKLRSSGEEDESRLPRIAELTVQLRDALTVFSRTRTKSPDVPDVLHKVRDGDEIPTCVSCPSYISSNADPPHLRTLIDAFPSTRRRDIKRRPLHGYF
jgi:hypothetical protein